MRENFQEIVKQKTDKELETKVSHQQKCIKSMCLFWIFSCQFSWITVIMPVLNYATILFFLRNLFASFTTINRAFS